MLLCSQILNAISATKNRKLESINLHKRRNDGRLELPRKHSLPNGKSVRERNKKIKQTVRKGGTDNNGNNEPGEM